MKIFDNFDFDKCINALIFLMTYTSLSSYQYGYLPVLVFTCTYIIFVTSTVFEYIINIYIY